MKKIIAIVLLAALLLTACGQPVTAEKTPQGGDTAQDGGNVQLANPWRDCTEEEAKALCPHALRVPDGAENVAWSVMEAEGQSALVQLSFDLNGMSYTARAQETNDKDADISGVYYTWTAQDEMTLQNWEDSAKNGSCFRYIGEEEWVDLCTWYDTAKGIS